ncbi:MAG: metallophosphoesterase [Clostridia bacterium]|nr:metallophosphoesterase [Clostridia bacterium]
MKKIFLIVVSILLLFCFSCSSIKDKEENQASYIGNDTSVNVEFENTMEFEKYISGKIYTLNKIKEQNNIGLSFAFLTDLHWQSNLKKSPIWLKRICDEVAIDKVVLGGDYVDYDYEDISIPKKIICDVSNAFSLFNYIGIVGNHDSNNNSHQGAPRIPDSEIFSLINNKSYEHPYYADFFESSKVCNLYLNSSIDSFDDKEQETFIFDTLKNLDESWSVLFFIHIMFDGMYQNNNLSVIRPAGLQFLNYVKSILPYLKCNIIGVFSGHSHLDYLNVTDYCIPCITTMCDALGMYNHNYNIYKRESNSSTGQAFDIVQIDLTAKKVFLTRIGAGSDRTYTY